MSNGAVNGTPPAFTRAAARRADRHEHTPEAAQDRMARVIGEHVAVQLGAFLQQAVTQPGCLFCVAARKQAERAWAVAAQNAIQAAEEPPAPPELPPVQQAMTWMPVAPAQGQPQIAVPVCYTHFQSGPAERAVGLVLPDGSPIVARQG